MIIVSIRKGWNMRMDGDARRRIGAGGNVGRKGGEGDGKYETDEGLRGGRVW